MAYGRGIHRPGDWAGSARRSAAIVHEQREIFEKFVRRADSKARRIKGTGIGLAMVRHIVEAHGGEVLLVSQPGEGSRFTIVFPEEAAS